METPATGERTYLPDMDFLCRPFELETSCRERIASAGKTLVVLLRKFRRLYVEALRRNEESTLSLLESGVLKNKQIRTLHRASVSGGGKFPLILRADMPAPGKMVEFHVGFRGLGHLHCFRRDLGKYYDEKSLRERKNSCRWMQEFKRKIGQKSKDVYFYTPSPRFKESAYLAGKIFDGRLQELEGVLPRGFSKKIKNEDNRTCLLQPSSRHLYDKIRRKGPLGGSGPFSRFFDCEGKIIAGLEAAGRMVIEPSLNLLFEQKILSALVYESEFYGLFTDEERELFPRTYLIKNKTNMGFPGVRRIEDIAELPERRRKFVLKYAGLDLDINCRSRAVYRLSELSQRKTREMLKKALLDYENFREPWIIQEDVSAKENIEYFDRKDKQIKSGSYYRLFRPYFFSEGKNGQTELIDIAVIFRKKFKVHKQNDSVYGIAN